MAAIAGRQATAKAVTAPAISTTAMAPPIMRDLTVIPAESLFIIERLMMISTYPRPATRRKAPITLC
jgi:hypothetical protein